MDSAPVAQQTAAPSKATAIPRLSRLPVPKSSIQNLRQHVQASATDKKSPTTTKHRARPASTIFPSARTPLASTQSNNRAPAHAHTSSIASDGVFKKPLGRPLGRPAQSTHRQASASSAGQSTVTDEVASVDSSWSASRTSSRQDYHNGDGSSSISSPEQPNTPREGKASHPSLSERAMESLSRVQPSPKLRRKSSFFAPDSPMAPQSRSDSSFGTRRGSQDSEMGSALSFTPLTGPSKVRTLKLSNSTLHTPSKRSISHAPPNLTRAQSPTKASQLRSVEKNTPLTPVLQNTTKAPIRGSKTISGRVQQARPGLTGVFNPLPPKPAAQNTPARTPKPKALPKKDLLQESKPTPKATTASKSSAALRETIRKAKLARQSLPGNQDNSAASDAFAMPEFDAIKHDDPFNQQPKGGHLVLQQRVNAARSEGRLNIAAMGLKEIPEEVLHMYDSKVIAESNTAWNECVDLTRFVAADNEIETIPDSAFPDEDPNSFSQDDDSTGSPFGGIEYLDLHGNVLFDVPRGLRTLSMLTTLNLSRNRLMNDALETIAQITSLRELKIADNLLTGELTSIEQLHSLEVLEVQDNKLSCLPDELCELVKLRVLNVSNNNLMDLPMNSLSKLPIVELLASKNKIKGSLFTTAVTTLPRLQNLDVSINALTTLYDGAAGPELPSLRALNVAYNQIVSLPDISAWTSLNSILAADNKITELPAGFVESISIRTADFTGNDFRKLDDNIALMESLDNFQVANNPLRERKYLTMNTEDLKQSLKAKLAPASFGM